MTATKTGILTRNATERKSGNKRYVLYPTVITLDNGNVVQVDRVEFHRQTKKMTLHYTDDTEKLKQTVDYLTKYYDYMKIYQQTNNQSAMIQASSYILKLNDMYENFDIVKLEQQKQYIIDNYSSETDLENLISTTQLDATLIKAILALNGKIQLK